MEKREDEPGRDGISQLQCIMLNVSRALHPRPGHILPRAADPSCGNYVLQMSDNISPPKGKAPGGGTAPVSTKLHSPL